MSAHHHDIHRHSPGSPPLSTLIEDAQIFDFIRSGADILQAAAAPAEHRYEEMAFGIAHYLSSIGSKPLKM